MMLPRRAAIFGPMAALLGLIGTTQAFTVPRAGTSVTLGPLNAPFTRHHLEFLQPCPSMPSMPGRRSVARSISPCLKSASEEKQAGLSPDDPRLVTIKLDRVTGIDFGCDITLRWPYVMSLTPNGAAECSGQVQVGDQLVAVGGQGVLGLTVADAMTKMAAATGSQIDLVFFRGTREELQSQLAASIETPASVQITVAQEGKPNITFMAPYGANLRDELVARKINVYQSVTRWTNCNGKQLCGTCIVDVKDGLDNCTRRSLDESSTLRENPATYKLACITNVYGDVAVQLHPEVGAAQWTR